MLAIYTRLSREDDNSTSIANQIREGKAFAKKNKHQYTVYNEGEGVSGTLELNERPKLFELITDVKNGDISSIWIRNQNRLDRNTATFYLFVSAVKKANAQVYFGDGDALDFNEPTTLLQTSIISSLNQYQAQLQSKQTKKALRDSVSEGKAWGVIPYGYSTDKNKLIIINQTEAETIKEIFHLSLGGWGVRRIATHLTDKGTPTKYHSYKGEIKIVNKYDKSITKRDKKKIVWSAKTILDILKNTWYIGTRIYSGIEYPTPVIIDKLLFDKVQKNLVKNINNSGKKVEYRYLLKGLLKCGKCGRNYYGRTRTSKKDNFYMCSSKRYKSQNCGNSSINIPYLETFIIKHLFNTRNLLNHLQELSKKDNSINELAKERKQIETNIITEGKTLERLATLLINEDLSNDTLFINKYKASKENISKLNSRLQTIDNSINERTSNTAINTYSTDIETVDLNNFTQLKEAIHNIVENINITSTINNNKVQYHFRIKYKNFTDYSIYSTIKPYDRWAHVSQAITDEPINRLIRNIRTVDSFLIDRTETKPISEDSLKPKLNAKYYLTNILIDKAEVIHFN